MSKFIPIVLSDNVVIGDNVTILLGPRFMSKNSYPFWLSYRADGFGFAPNPDGTLKNPQIGNVIIDDDIGACSPSIELQWGQQL
jgi:UDP-3-O-[3-hydroxymyristoyl] glucosamine N-acyltransferase